MNKYKAPIAFTFIFGTLPIVAFFTFEPTITAASKALDEVWMPIIAAFAILLGVVNVVQNNVSKIKKRASGWLYSVALLSGLVSMGFTGFMGALGWFGGTGMKADGSHTPFSWMSQYFFIPLQSTMFALLSFYVASAAFRAFRARNIAATLLLISGVFVMLGRIPFGDMMVSFIPGAEGAFSRVTEWLLDCPNAAAQRGIIIGAALGAASMSLKVLLGIERSYLGKEQEE